MQSHWRQHPDEGTKRQHRLETPARVVADSPATRPETPDPPMGVPPPPLLWRQAYSRWQCRGRRGLDLPRVRRLRMGSLLPGCRGAEYRVGVLGSGHRPLRIRQPQVMNDTRDPEEAATDDDGGALDPREAARLLAQTSREARRQ